MILGFSTGRIEEISLEDRLGVYKKLGCKAIELGAWADDQRRWDAFFALSKEDLKNFEHISVHAPAGDFVYKDDEQTHSVLEKLEKLYQQTNFKFAVIHPDRVEDWSVFKKYSFPFAIENMDNQKVSFQDSTSLQKVFDQVDVPMVLDVNHCFVNDPSMKLTEELYDSFGDRIKEIHLSGFLPEEIHETLFRTEQVEIFQAIQDKKVPIILEGRVNSLDDIRREYEYVKNLFE